MSLNRFMHPRSPYFNNAPDFSKLPDYYPDLKKYLNYDKNKCKYVVDFYNPHALKALCCALLKQTFNLEIDIPTDHLIPRVPQRVNYCLWIEDLINKKLNSYGIDIGCGSSCIYALILCRLNKNCKMLVSDIDDVNIEYATKNVKRNQMNDQIKIKKVENGALLRGLLDENIEYDFLMCNPPFYKNYYEAQGLESTRKPHDRHDPSSINTAADCECIFDEGGEVGFICKMIDESIALGKKIRIYTTMIGKKSSFLEIKKYLIEVKGIKNISDARFCQGHTLRWAIAWSFNDESLPKFDYMKKEKKKNEEPIHYEIKEKYFSDNYKIEYIYSFIKNLLLNELQVAVLKDLNKYDNKLLFIARENTWSHQRRKRRMEMRKTNIESTNESEIINQESNKRKLDTELGDEFDLKKKLKTDEDLTIVKSDLIKCEIELKLLNKIIYLQMNCLEAVTKDYAHQILQFIKNKIEKLSAI